MRSQNWDIENIILTNVEMLHLQYSAEVVEQKLIIFLRKLIYSSWHGKYRKKLEELYDLSSVHI